MADDAQQRSEAYLSSLRGHLRDIRDQDVREIVEELRSHIMEKATAGGGISHSKRLQRVKLLPRSRKTTG